jgi:hypothetical protein
MKCNDAPGTFPWSTKTDQLASSPFNTVLFFYSVKEKMAHAGRNLLFVGLQMNIFHISRHV